MKISWGQSRMFVEILHKQKNNKTPMKWNASLQRNLSLHPTPVKGAALDTLESPSRMSNNQLLARSHHCKPAYTRMLFEQIKEFFTSVQERQELLSPGCYNITDEGISCDEHSLFQIAATHREKVLESVILSVPGKTLLPNKNSDKGRSVAQIPFFLDTMLGRNSDSRLSCNLTRSDLLLEGPTVCFK